MNWNATTVLVFSASVAVWRLMAYQISALSCCKLSCIERKSRKTKQPHYPLTCRNNKRGYLLFSVTIRLSQQQEHHNSARLPNVNCSCDARNPISQKISCKFPAANTVNTVWTEITRFHANYMIFMATSSVTLVGRRNRKVSGSRCQSLQQQLLNNAVTTDRTSQRRSKFRSAASTEPVPPRSRSIGGGFVAGRPW